MSESSEPAPAEDKNLSAPARKTVDVSALPDGSGNDRDDDEQDDERFDAG
jgi:hypothetical protein